ncbi:VanZ family protein [Tumebacillus permanentifrigoris]|uniref:VanZ like protein n=1 Tax=Tumebacillus permanentifrigoris TaxID=378543 RepID=A0A316DA87_9BACL|nr:VanZ family protein [Tumebacillus permanentifrigoris]PWK13899.1 VanZ like protein [Tumebacillus permanentifrigoris]
MSTKSQRFPLFLALTVIWMGVIYWKSAQSYSQQDLKPWLTTLISEQTLLSILPKLQFTYDGDLVTYLKPFGLVEFFVRKGAHITEYFILALLFWQTFAATRLARPWVFLLAASCSVLYAASDEWHQSFVPNRTGHPIDVGMDAVGVVLAMLLCLLWQGSQRKKLSRHA